MTEPRSTPIAKLLAGSRLARTAVLAAVLTVPSLIIAMQLYAGYRFEGVRVSFAGGFIMQLVHWEWWAVFGPFVWRLERRWPLAAVTRRASLLRHIAAAPAVALTVLLLNLVAYHALLRVPAISDWFVGMNRDLASTATFYFAAFFHVELLIYAAIVTAAHAARTGTLLRNREQEALRLEAALTNARLTALRTQLQPHFLFNTLHTIGSFVLQRQNERAVQLLAELGELLRSTLAHRDTDLAPLGDEIEYVRRYLRIEEARFGDRLRIEWAIEPAALDALVPPFILQPLIENAFRHGISRRTEDSQLKISATTDNESLHVAIYNDGPRLAEGFSMDKCAGYGLENVRERLRTRSPAGRIELSNAAGGVCVTLVLPLWARTTARAAL